jgi:hypothetical protein
MSCILLASYIISRNGEENSLIYFIFARSDRTKKGSEDQVRGLPCL